MVANSKTEYTQCFESWRFIVGVRFTVLGFFLSLTSALLYGVFTIPFFKNPATIYVIAIIGIIVTWAFIMLEGRNRQLYYVCIKRAEDIECLNSDETSNEQQMLIRSSLARNLNSAPKKIYEWHTGATFGLYIIALLIWVGMFILTLMEILPIQTGEGIGINPCI